LQSLYGEFKSELIIKKSKFIAIAKNIDSEREALSFLLKQKKIYHDAKHVVFAYVLINKKKYHDDGEPSGTAGSAVIKFLEQNNFMFVIFIIARYFGGILLGANNLKRAYINSIRLVLQKALIINLDFYNKILIEFDYESLEKINRVLLKFSCELHDLCYDIKIKAKLFLREDFAQKILQEIKNMINNKFKVLYIKKQLGVIINSKFISYGESA